MVSRINALINAKCGRMRHLEKHPLVQVLAGLKYKLLVVNMIQSIKMDRTCPKGVHKVSIAYLS